MSGGAKAPLAPLGGSPLPKIGTGGHEALCKMATDSNKRDFDSDILYTFSFTFCVLTENKIFIVLFGILCGTAVNFG